jgi:RNA polymerase subunit RPABC4/transcription elongation factor Spt4
MNASRPQKQANEARACQHCGALVYAETRRCPQCGRFPVKLHQCPRCRSIAGPNDDFCWRCGRIFFPGEDFL